MLKRHADRILRAPAATVDEGGTDLESHEDPSSMGSWMDGLGPIDGGPIQPLQPLPPKKKEPDGKPDAKSGGDTNAGLPATAKPVVEPAVKPADAAANAKVADDAAKAAADTAATTAKAAAADEAKKAEAAKEKPADPGAEKWPRSSSDWDKYKKVHAEKEGKLQAEIDARDARIKEFETKLKTVEETAAKAGEPAPEVKTQLERLAKENEEMSRRLQVLDVTQHPKFQAHYTGRVDAQKDLAKRILGQDKATEFEKVIALPDGDYKNEQLDAFVSDLPMLQQSRIGAVLNSLEAINQDRAADIAKAEKLKSELTAEQLNAQKTNAETAAAENKKVYADVLASMQSEKEGMAIFQHRPGDEAWNKAVDERIAAASKLLSGQGLKKADVFKAAFHATAMPAILKAYQDDMREKDDAITKLEEQVKALSAAQPGGGASATPGDGSTSTRSEVRIGQTPQEALGSWMKNALPEFTQ